MNTKIQPLVVTPHHYQGESLKGFILRTSELNGYHTPSIMLSTAGMTSGEMNMNVPPLEKLIPLYGRPAQEFKSLGYDQPWPIQNIYKNPILHHQVPSLYISGKQPKICPECILEKGYIEAFWDLKYAVACPIHSKAPIQECPECKDSLHWFRPGQLKCRCGCDLSLHRGVPISDLTTLGLLGLLRSKLQDDPLDYLLLKERLGFPIEHLDTMNFTTLLGLIGRLEGREINSNYYDEPQRKNLPVKHILSRAAKALSHWPSGFYAYLKHLDAEGLTKPAFGLRMQFESFYQSFFKSGLPVQEVAFVKEAFVSFGNDVWKKAYVDKKLNSDASQNGQLVGIYGLAKKLNVMTTTARHLVEGGNIPHVTLTMNGVSRQLFDLSQKLPFELTIGKTYALRNAAAWLGLPVSVLKVLREQGIFEVRHLANPIHAYHERDLEVFRDKLLDCVPRIKAIESNDLITLERCMLMKTGHDVIKASIVAALIQKKLRPIGMINENIGSIGILKSDLHSFMFERKSLFFGTTTIVAAAKKLHCDPLVVKNLYDDGLLTGVQKPNAIFIREDSLEEFAEKYVSCAAIASKHNTNSNKIVSLCKEKAVSVYWFPRAENLPSQPFVDRKYADLTWQ